MAESVEDHFRIKEYQVLGIVGIALSVLSSVFMAAGLCLQKLVQKNMMNNPSLQRIKIYRNGTYVAGKYLLKDFCGIYIHSSIYFINLLY